MNEEKVRNPLARQLLADIENDYVLRAKDIVTTIHSLEADKQELVEALRVALTHMPKSSAQDGGANRHSQAVRDADMVRALLSKHGGA